jgi:hypothetical protein
MSDTAEQLANLDTFYRTMTTEQLDLYRVALWLDRERARRDSAPVLAQPTIDHATARLALIAKILASRGIRYRIDDGRRITCFTCGRTSHNLHDVEQRYCGHCHVFHDDQARTGGA